MLKISSFSLLSSTSLSLLNQRNIAFYVVERYKGTQKYGYLQLKV